MHVVRKIASLLLAGAAVSALLSGCHGGSTNTSLSTVTPPTVDFTYSPATSPTGLTLQFTGIVNNTASGTTPAYSWTFGDGTTLTTAVTTQSPSHTFPAPGTYTVTFTAAAGTSASRTQQVAVSCAPGQCVSQFDYETWALASGSHFANSTGFFETQLTPSQTNLPSARQGTASWSDNQGRLWMFGGAGYDAGGTNGALNDLWRFDPSNGQWTWVGGSNKANGLGVYGNAGKQTIGTIIGGRAYAAHWTDKNGNLWLFGGNGFDSAGNVGYLGDMWMISPVTGTPTWMGGSNTVNTATSGMPGPRAYATVWTDAQGNFWLFGGQTVNSSGTSVLYNDLWTFNPSTSQWTNISGSTTAGSTAGVYGTMGTTAATNAPGARLGGAGWTDNNGFLWLFGGSGYDTAGAGGILNDMWKFDPSVKQWTWVAGSNAAGGTSVQNYGVIGTAGSYPSARAGAAAWTDTATGRLWMFGGGGFDSTAVSTTSTGGGDLSDLWSFNPSTGKWAWMGGPSVAGAAGIFAAPQAYYAMPGSSQYSGLTGANYSQISTPGARMWGTVWWVQPATTVYSNWAINSSGSCSASCGTMWLFGGSGVDQQLTNGSLNDLWTIGVNIAAP